LPLNLDKRQANLFTRCRPEYLQLGLEMATENLEQRLLGIEKLPIEEQVAALDELVQELEKNLL